jgi:hypothetical protein
MVQMSNESGREGCGTNQSSLNMKLHSRIYPVLLSKTKKYLVEFVGLVVVVLYILSSGI